MPINASELHKTDFDAHKLFLNIWSEIPFKRRGREKFHETKQPQIMPRFDQDTDIFFSKPHVQKHYKKTCNNN